MKKLLLALLLLLPSTAHAATIGSGTIGGITSFIGIPQVSADTVTANTIYIGDDPIEEVFKTLDNSNIPTANWTGWTTGLATTGDVEIGGTGTGKLYIQSGSDTAQFFVPGGSWALDVDTGPGASISAGNFEDSLYQVSLGDAFAQNAVGQQGALIANNGSSWVTLIDGGNSNVATFYNGTNTLAIYDGTYALNATGNIIVSGTGRFDGNLIDASSVNSVEVNNRILDDENGAFSVDYTTNRFMADSSGHYSLDWANRTLNNSSSTSVTNWENQALIDSSGVSALEWTNRYLRANDGSDIILDWSTVGTAEFGDSNIQTSGSITDGTTTITGGNYTGVGNITGSDVDISMGTGTGTTTGEVTANVFDIPTTASATEGVINQNNLPLIHTYAGSGLGGNLFIGGAGNFTLTTQYRNVGIGLEAFRDLTSLGGNNVALGYRALANLETASQNFALGTQALGNLKTGSGSNTAIGTFSMLRIDTGYNNLGFGRNCATHIDLGSYGNVMIGNYIFGAGTAVDDVDANTIIGSRAANTLNVGGSGSPKRNVVIGFWAAFAGGLGNGNIIIGNKCGYDETGSDTLMIDNIDRTSEALGRTGAIIYGIMDADPANQTLALHADTTIGDATNNTNFASDGLMTMAGTARVNKEFSLLLTDFNPGASGPTKALNDIYPTYEFTIDDDMHTSFEMPDDWAVGTDLTVEVYWAIDEAYVTNSGEVRWSADWRAVAVGEVISGGASGNMDFEDVNIPATANTVVKTEATVSGASLAMDDLVAFNGARIALVAGNNPTAEPYIVAVRVEYIADKLGEAR